MRADRSCIGVLSTTSPCPPITSALMLIARRRRFPRCPGSLVSIWRNPNLLGEKQFWLPKPFSLYLGSQPNSLSWPTHSPVSCFPGSFRRSAGAVAPSPFTILRSVLFFVPITSVLTLVVSRAAPTTGHISVSTFPFSPSPSLLPADTLPVPLREPPTATALGVEPESISPLFS